MLWRIIKNLLFLAFAIFLSLFFLLSQFNYSRHKALWLDENHGIGRINGMNVLPLIIKGPPGQSSKAPLDYLLIKALNYIRKEVKYFNFQPTTYLRLVSIFSTFLLTILGVWFAWFYCRTNDILYFVQGISLLFALLFAWFQPHIYSYAALARPYALWNSLWFLCLSLFFLWPRLRLLSILCLTLLAFTVTTSIFQIMALSVSFLIVRLIEKEKWQSIFKEGISLFLIPTLVSLYYCLKAGQWGYIGPQWGTWSSFLNFWYHFKYVGIGSVIIIALCLLKDSTRPYVIPSMSVLLLYLMGPIIYMITRYKGFFFSNRQYVYYELAIPIFFLTVAYCYPYWRVKKIKLWPKIIMIIFCLLIWKSYDQLSSTTIVQAKQVYFSSEIFGVPIDSEGKLSNLLETELPKAFCISEKNDQTKANIKRFAEWLSLKYNNLPIGDKNVVLKPSKDKLLIFPGAGVNNAEVISITVDDCSKGDLVLLKLPFSD